MKPYNRTIQGDTLYEVINDVNPVFNSSGSYRQASYTENLQVPTVGQLHGDFSTPNSWAFTRDTVNAMRGKQNVHSNGETRYYTGIISQIVDRYQTSEFQSFVYSEALDRLNEKVRGRLDLSIDALQANQNVRMVRKLKELVDFVRSFKRGVLQEAYKAFARREPIPPRELRGLPRKLLFFRKRRVAQRRRSSSDAAAYVDWFRELKRRKEFSAKAVGGRWLEFQYGWKPLAQDLYDLSITLVKRYPKLMVIEAKAKEPFNGGLTQTWGGDPDLKCQIRYNGADRCHIKIRMNPPATVQQLMGQYTSLNPASILWELMPYSFVVDWVYNVGGYLRALETELAYGSLFRDGFIVRTFLNEGTCEVPPSFVSYGGDRYTTTDIKGSYRRTRYDRSILLGYPIAVQPVFHVSLSSHRLLNAAALLSQHLR